MEERIERIYGKGFDMINSCYAAPGSVGETDYRKIKVGVKQLEDAVLSLDSLENVLPAGKYGNKPYILQHLAKYNVPEIRKISELYYNINGIYQKLCEYFAFLYRYDWYVVPEVYGDSPDVEKLLKDFTKILNYFDKSYIKKLCGEISLEVIKNGAYYGYIVPSNEQLVLQQLPVDYCRSRYNVGGWPAVEFNMKYFDTIRDPGYRMRVIGLFPEEFAKGYMLYKKGKLLPDVAEDRNGGSWYLLNPENTVKFNFNGSDVPAFANAIPAIIDLDQAQELDRRKQMQKLLKIIIQKLPRDKNGDLIFDVDEAKDIHNNAVNMIGKAVGVDVLTTFAEIDSVDMSDKNTATSVDDLEKVERAVFNSAGITQNLFNAEGNLSMKNSILVDEGSVRNLILQYNMFFDRIVQKMSKNKKKYNFKIYLLETTQFNYTDLSKMYKEQTQLGYSKLLPQIALGHSQSFILNTAHFENEILHLSEIMIPPLSSNTMNAETLQALGNKNQSASQKTQDSTEGNSAGRPEIPDDQKSEKTIQNLESMS